MFQPDTKEYCCVWFIDMQDSPSNLFTGWYKLLLGNGEDEEEIRRPSIGLYENGEFVSVDTLLISELDIYTDEEINQQVTINTLPSTHTFPFA